MSQNVLLFKAISEDDTKEDSYLKAINEQFEFNVIPVSVLKFEFQNEDVLSEELQNPKHYDGLILTSPRSVEAVSRVFSSTFPELSQDILRIWRENKICYVVGDASFERVKNDLLWSEQMIMGQDAGNAKNLSQKIIQDFAGKQHSKFLFPCGNLKRDILPDNLSRAGINLENVECYKTQQADDLERSIREFKNDFCRLDFAAFFSPSGIKFSWPILKSHLPDFELSCNFISIGPVTTEALKAKGCVKVFTAEAPNVAGLVEAFRSAVWCD